MRNIALTLACVAFAGDGCRVLLEQLQSRLSADSHGRPLQVNGRGPKSILSATVNLSIGQARAERTLNSLETVLMFLLTVQPVALFNPSSPVERLLLNKPAFTNLQPVLASSRGCLDNSLLMNSKKEHLMRNEVTAYFSNEHMDCPLSRRVALTAAAALLSTMPQFAAHAELSGDSDELGQRYSSGERAQGGIGRGANAMLRLYPDTGIVRIGGTPLFKPGQILDSVRSKDGSAVDLAFSFPENWSLSRGPNLDVRDIATTDCAFVLVAPLPKDASDVEPLPKKFFTDLVFDKQGKYGAYGTPNLLSIKNWEMVTPSSGSSPYRRAEIRFEAITSNYNTVERRELISATALGGSVFVFISDCLGLRYKQVAPSLTQVRDSFRAYKSGNRAA